MTEHNKPGPKPKQLVETTIMGIAVGRDKTVVPPDQVYELAALGCNDGEIARFFGVNEDTLRYNFKSELEKAREFVKIRLRRAMFKNACDNMNAAVQIFLAKNILGMTDQPVNAEANAPLPWHESTDQGDNENDTIGETDTETDQSL
jgi:hypothetical protein